MTHLIRSRPLRIALHLVFGAVFLVAGKWAASELEATGPEMPRKPPAPPRALVATAPAVAKDHAVWVEGMGSVTPAQSLDLLPELTARVEWADPGLLPGALVTAGQELVKLDARDYRLAVKSQEGQVAKALYELKAESSRGRVAKEEWDLLEAEIAGAGAEKEAGKELALRKPQLESARIALESAKSALDRAKLLASKTTLQAPFNAFVQTEQVEVGDLATPLKKLATLIGTDRVFVIASVPVFRLERLRVPGVNAQPGQGSFVRVQHHPGGEVVIEREGRIERLYGDLDALGKMARLVVAVEDPLDLRRPLGERRLPLLVGAQVSVRIEALPVTDSILLPRVALRDGDNAWVMGPDDRLQVRAVDVVWRLEDSVLVARGGLAPGDRVVTSRLASPVPGMLLVEEGAAEKSAQAPPAAQKAAP